MRGNDWQDPALASDRQAEHQQRTTNSDRVWLSGYVRWHGIEPHAARGGAPSYALHHHSQGILDALYAACVEQQLIETQLVLETLAEH